MLDVHGSWYAQNIFYYKGPQQHGTDITNVKHCNAIGYISYCNINEHSIYTVL